MDNTEDPALLNHIFTGDEKFYIDSMSDATKAQMIKDAMIKCALDIIDKLNETVNDVKFDLAWHRLCVHQNFSPSIYDHTWCSDQQLLNLEDDFDLKRFYATSLEEIGLEIRYTWEQKCDLGHTHYKKRYHIFSAPQWLTIMSDWRLKPDPVGFIKQNLTDFFYSL